MDKGIRPFCNAKFIELLPTRVNSREGNIVFRKEVRFAVMEAFGATEASASTHYNHAFIQARKMPELAALLEGLGRPEDKKGGRKPKVVAVVETPAETPAAPAAAEETPAAAPVTPAVVWPFAEGYVAPQAPAAAPEETTELVGPVGFVVRRKKDQEIVGSFGTQEEAEAVIAKAKAAKKAALELAA